MGLKYTSSFDSIRTRSRYTVNIYQDSYDGSPIDVILGATPVVQEWQEDDPLAPIKGSTLKINLITTGTLNLLDFYSDNDNEFIVELLGDDIIGTQITLFKGFIQQDDCSEVQIDFVHQITLTATDNLGTIKDISLGRAAELFGDLIAVGGIPVAFVPGSYIVIDWGAEWPVRPGQTFTVGGMTYTMVTNLGEIDGTYAGWCIQVVEDIPAVPPGTLAISYKEIQSLEGYVPLMTFIKLCLRATYVQNMGLNVYNHITPSDGEIFVDTFQTRIFEDVTVLGNTFLKNNEYMSCYDVLEAIIKRFNMSCFQSLGSWWVVRYPDLFLDFEEGETAIDYYNYNSDFVYVDQLTINKSYTIATGAYVETGLLKSIIRPYRRTLETFNYVIPESLLCNSQFTDLGPLRQVTTGGGFTNREYELPCWYNYDGGSPYPDRFIRVVFDADGKEVDRYAIVTGPNFDDSKSVQSNNIELKQNDIINFTFQFRSDVSQPGNVNCIFDIRISDGTTTYYLNNDGTWDTSTGWSFNVPSGDNTNVWHSVQMKSQQIPFNCIMNVFLAEVTSSSSNQTWYKDLKLEVTNEIAGQPQIIGHSHNASQSKELNNVNNVEIFIDNTFGSSISGTLFLTTQTGLLQNKCTTWEFGNGNNTGFPGKVYDNLGQLITETYMYQRYKPRSKYNGNLLYIRNQNGIMSNLSIFSNEFTGALVHNKMLFGSLSIDYKNDSAEFTMWEVFNKDLPIPANNFDDFTNYLFNILYQFNYLYENN